MNFKEAYEAMKSGKKCWIPEEHTYPLYLVVNGYIGFDNGAVKGLEYELSPKIAASENWQIYEERQKVQTAEEYVSSKFKGRTTEWRLEILEIQAAFEAGQKSERNAHAKLIESATELFKGGPVVNITSALENLKKYYKETE